jgi:hypothetical protein
MWVLWILLALGFIVGSAMILLRTAQVPKMPKKDWEE